MKKSFPKFLTIVTVALICAGAAGSSLYAGQTDVDIDSILKKVELIPIMINGDSDNRINIVIMNRWRSNEKAPYNSPEMRGEFIKDINESLIAALTPGDPRAQTAYANYREFFNVYGLWYPDTPEWGKGIDEKIVNALRAKFFLPWKDEYTGWVTFLVMPNRTGGGGGAARNLEDRVGTALIAGNGIGKMLHEIAHTCMSIGDEYTAAATGLAAIPTYSVEVEYNRDKIKWRKWIKPDTPLPTPYREEYKNKIGAFEGAQYHLTGYFRSTAQGCIMGAGVFDNTEKMCPICEQRVAMRVNVLVNPVNSYSPENTKIIIEGKKKIHFEIDHITPVPNTQVVRWILNGKTIAAGVDEVDVEFSSLSDYELICSLTDETPFIRPDPPYAKYPRREIRWQISNFSPSSKADELNVSLHSKRQGDAALDQFILSPVISGGTPPYTYLWSTGNTEKNLEHIGPGIYDLAVIDSEFRMKKSNYSIYANSQSDGKPEKVKKSSKVFDFDVNITASEKDKDNGKIILTSSGGSGLYRFMWRDKKYEYGKERIYEAENALVKIPGLISKEYFDAGNNTFIDFNGEEGSITWTIEVIRNGSYPLDFVYGGISRQGTPMNISVNGKPVDNSLVFPATRPLFTGWEKVAVTTYLNQGTNTVTLNSKGKSGANIDYLRVPVNCKMSPVNGNKRINLSPGDYTVVVTDGDNKTIEKTIIVPEVYPFEINNLKIVSRKPGMLSIVDPLPGYTYKWYSKNAPLFTMKKNEKALYTGTEFVPPAPGNYYVSAKNNLTNGESSNRICFAVDQNPGLNEIEKINPSSLEDERIILWFDSSDLDGDGKKDGTVPERGPLPDWRAKTWRNRGKIFTKYEPNKLNGMGVCAFDLVWVSNMGLKVSDFQTIILVYKESSMTFPGKSPFRELNKYIGKSADSEKRLFDPETIHDVTKNGRVFLNGEKVDPFNTANPMDFCILTIEFESAVNDSISGIEGYWEGEIAEMIFINGTLSEIERKGIEEYLRKKWFSTVDLEF